MINPIEGVQDHSSESEFNEFEPRLKFPKLSAGFNLETLNTNLSRTNHI